MGTGPDGGVIALIGQMSFASLWVVLAGLIKEMAQLAAYGVIYSFTEGQNSAVPRSVVDDLIKEMAS